MDEKFTVYIPDKANHCFVTVVGVGTVQIKKEDDGIVVDIFPLVDATESVASTSAFTKPPRR